MQISNVCAIKINLAADAPLKSQATVNSIAVTNRMLSAHPSTLNILKIAPDLRCEIDHALVLPDEIRAAFSKILTPDWFGRPRVV